MKKRIVGLVASLALAAGLVLAGAPAANATISGGAQAQTWAESYYTNSLTAVEATMPTRSKREPLLTRTSTLTTLGSNASS